MPFSKSVLCISVCAVTFIASLPAFCAQPDSAEMGVDAIKAEMQSDWQKAVSTCDQYGKSRISGVAIVTGAARIKAREKVYENDGRPKKIFPNARYLRAAFTSQISGPIFVTFGPVQNSAKASDFKSVIGMPICDQGSGD